ncbi:hypothetical protein Droror1_Dr00007155 [Drosera rotundifolia]
MAETEQQQKEGNLIQRPSRFNSVCVFCGSSSGKRDSYRDAAIELGQELVARGVGLVYGGGSIGLMGLVSQTVHRGGGHVLGIIPRSLMGKEITGETVGEVRPVSNMHQRKAEMARHSDCFIALPGGYGTLEELLEVITWAQLGIHDKPVCETRNQNELLQSSCLYHLVFYLVVVSGKEVFSDGF